MFRAEGTLALHQEDDHELRETSFASLRPLREAIFSSSSSFKIQIQKYKIPPLIRLIRVISGSILFLFPFKIQNS